MRLQFTFRNGQILFSNTMASVSHRTSIASLTQEISFLTEHKQQWKAETSEALGHIEALREYASVLRTTLSQVEAAASLLQRDFAHRMKALFDEPMDELWREITAIRGKYQRLLREDVIPPSPKYRTIGERVPPMCLLFETYAAVNGESMRLPPDVVEGIIPMVGREKSLVIEYVINDMHEILRRRMLSRRFLDNVSSEADTTIIVKGVYQKRGRHNNDENARPLFLEIRGAEHNVLKTLRRLDALKEEERERLQQKMMRASAGMAQFANFEV